MALLGLGMATPILPLYLTDVDVNVSVIGWLGAGAVIASIPGGRAITLFGQGPMLLASFAAMGLSLAAIGLTSGAIQLSLLLLCAGSGSVIGRIALQSFITGYVPDGVRARAMSLIGGTRRIGFFIGPVIGGVLTDRYGASVALAVAGGVCGASLVPALIQRTIPTTRQAARPQASLMAGFKRHWQLLLRSAIGPCLVLAARTGRSVIVPLFGIEFGLSATQVGFLFAVGTGADLLLFPVAGHVMDRFGRLYAIVPAFGLLAVGLVALGSANSVAAVIAATVTMGIGNGLSAGTMLTLGSDVAPRAETSDFLAGFAAIQGIGQISGPVIVGLMAVQMSLSASAYALAAVMAAAIAWIVLVVGETKDRVRI